MKDKILSVNSLLWLALVLALAGSVKHLAAIFASIDGNLFMGWLQAIAIDTGLFALAYSIRLRKVADRSVKPIWFGVVIFTVISVYGNLAYGLYAINGILPQWIVWSKPIILAASLPILVLFLSELLSDDRQFAKAGHTPIITDDTPTKNIPVTLPKAPGVHISQNGKNGTAPKKDKAPAGKVAKRLARERQLLSEGMAWDEIAAELGISDRTAARDKVAIEA